MECRKPQKRKNLRLLILTTNLSKPGHDVAGLFFCLASAEGAGLLFCPAAMHPYTSVYSEFCAVHATIPHMPQNSAQGFTAAFPEICHILPPTIPDRQKRIYYRLRNAGAYHNAVALQRIPRHQTPHKTLYRATQPPYYNNVYKGAAYRRPCKPGGVSSYRVRIRWQVLTWCQQHRPGAPADGSASPPV